MESIKIKTATTTTTTTTNLPIIICTNLQQQHIIYNTTSVHFGGK